MFFYIPDNKVKVKFQIPQAPNITIPAITSPTNFVFSFAASSGVAVIYCIPIIKIPAKTITAPIVVKIVPIPVY